jgi:DNA-binding transcriptional MerR regulator
VAALVHPVATVPLVVEGEVGDALRPQQPAQKSQAAFRTISEVAGELDVAQHVLRFWESKFPQVRPLKRGGGRRYYRPEDVELLRQIRALLYDEGYTIKGAQKLLRARRAAARPAAAAAAASRGVASAPLPSPAEPPPAPPPAARRSAPVAVPPPPAAEPAPAGLPGELRALKAELVELRDLLRRARAAG